MRSTVFKIDENLPCSSYIEDARRLSPERLLAFLISAMWVAAAVAKSLHVEQLRDMVRVILPFSGRWPLAIAGAVILTELAAGLALLFRKARPYGAALSLMLASGFVMVNLIRIIEGLHAPCSCFGILFTFSPSGALALDLLIASAAWCLIRAATSRTNAE